MRPEGASTHSSDLDESYETYRQHGDQEMDPIEAKKVLRKIDLRLVPILVVIYFLQYIDKNGINYASVYGLQKGTNLRGQDYSWFASTTSSEASFAYFLPGSEASSTSVRTNDRLTPGVTDSV